LIAAPAPVPKDDVEKKILQVLEEMGQDRGIGVPREDGRLLRLLVESCGAKHVVELGTYRGYSGIWMCLGLRTTGGKLTTFEIDKDNAQTSRANFKRAGVDSLVNLIEGDAHKEVARVKDPVDLVFIDADKEGYLDYLNQLLPQVRAGGLVVAHNMDPGRADPDFVKAITTNPALETVFVTAGSGGISVSLKKR
jgi:predicted O-methyltransferase YrrM